MDNNTGAGQDLSGYVLKTELANMSIGNLVYYGGAISVSNEPVKTLLSIVQRATRSTEYIIWESTQLTDLPPSTLPWASGAGSLWLKIEMSGSDANAHKKITISDSNNQTATRIVAGGSWHTGWRLLSRDAVNTSNFVTTTALDTALAGYLKTPQQILAGADLDTYSNAGMYRILTNAIAREVANIPVTGTAGSLLVEKHAGTKQTFTTYTANNPLTFVRNLTSSTAEWGPWVEMATINSLSSYVTSSSLTTSLSDYVTKSNLNCTTTQVMIGTGTAGRAGCNPILHAGSGTVGDSYSLTTSTTVNTAIRNALSGYVTTSTLNNYYNKTQVDSLMTNVVKGATTGYTIQVVTSMPASPAANTIYLVTGN